MKLHFFSYRYSQEILQHENNCVAWFEIENILRSAPLFDYPNKSPKNKRLSVVQQLMNTYFDRRFAVDFDWLYHPLATRISDSGLAADFRKTFPNITIQAEVQFGNMARWYSDIFKLQTAYSQSLVDCGLCVVPVSSLAKKIDSNIAEFERVCREIPAANLSITLPILIVGLEVDESTSIVDVSSCQFANLNQIVGKGNEANRWRVVNGYIDGVPMSEISARSPRGRHLFDPKVPDDTDPL